MKIIDEFIEALELEKREGVEEFKKSAKDLIKMRKGMTIDSVEYTMLMGVYKDIGDKKRIYEVSKELIRLAEKGEFGNPEKAKPEVVLKFVYKHLRIIVEQIRKAFEEENKN